MRVSAEGARRWMRRVGLFALLVFACCTAIAGAIAAVLPVPPLTARVIDQSSTLDAAQQQALESKLSAFEASNGGQIAVLIVPTTGDETIEQYSIRVVDAWKPGRKGVDDGLLVLVAKDDRKVRIEVGRDYEGVIPDALANRIIDGYMTPKFLAGDYSGGLNDGVDQLIGLANGGTLPQLPQPSQVNSPAATALVPAGTPVPALSGHVVNQTYLLTDAQIHQIDAKLSAFEKGKERRIAVLLVESTGEETGEHYSWRVFDAWKLGANGVLIFISEDPYDKRIVTGSGLAEVFPNGVLHRVLNEDMSWPRVKLGDVAGEINGGVDRIIKIENGEAMPPPPKPEGSFKWSLLDAISPPPFTMGRWLGMIVGLPFVIVFAFAILGGKAALLRGCVTLPVVAGFVLLLGSGWLFALLLGVIAFTLAMHFDMGELPEHSGSSVDQPDSNGSFGSAAWGIFGILARSTISGGGGRGGFSGGGGGFSGGGASGRW